MRARLSSRSFTPLIEILIVLLFFSFVLTVVLEVFAASEAKSVLSADINRAVLVAEDCAEHLKGKGVQLYNGTEILEGFASEKSGASRLYTRMLDRDWNRVADEEEAHYLIQVTLTEAKSQSGTLISGNIIVYRIPAGGDINRREILTDLKFGDYSPL